MPVTKSAKKSLRQAKRREAANKRVSERYKEAVKALRTKPTHEGFGRASRLLARAAKLGVIHRNKASRLKSRLAKLLPQKSTKRAKSSKKRAS